MNKTLFILALTLIIVFSGCLQQGTASNANSQSAQGGKNVSGEIVSNGDTVKVEYKAFVGDDLIDSSEKTGNPLEFKVGAHEVVAGFEEAVLGHRLNDAFETTVQPEKAYGNKDPKLIIEIPKEKIPDADKVQKGMVLTSSNGKTSGIVVEVKSNAIKVDFNHPLAGKTLKFWIKIVELIKKS